jgi:adenosylhomocysteine nucleosidase
MIAITFALPAESSGILGQLQSKRRVVRDRVRIWYGLLENREVAILHTGVGRRSCQRTIEMFLNTVRPDILISSGFAGSLSGKLQAGDVIIGENFADSELVARLLKSKTPGTQRLSYQAAKLITTESMVDSSQERERMAQEQGADAIDMETEFIAQACATHGIPMVSLRVISDSPAAPFPAPPQILFDVARQRTNFRKLIPYVLTHPAVAPRLFRFARQIRRARAVLTEGIIDAIAKLG